VKSGIISRAVFFFLQKKCLDQCSKVLSGVGSPKTEYLTIAFQPTFGDAQFIDFAVVETAPP
jgi:hypothetical protein